MAAALLSDFRTAYPEYSETPDATIQRYLDESATYVKDCWGDDQLNGGLYYAAHYVNADIDQAAAKNIKSIGSGSHKVEFDTAGRDTFDFTSTRYGRLFSALYERNKGCDSGRPSYYVAAI